MAPPVEIRRTPSSDEAIHRRSVRSGQDVDRDPGFGHNPGDLIGVDQSRGVHDFGPRIPIRTEPGDGVVEVAEAVEGVLGPGGQDQAALPRPFGGGGHPFGRHLDRIDRLGDRVVVLDRTPGGAGVAQEPNGFGNTGQVIGSSTARSRC